MTIKRSKTIYDMTPQELKRELIGRTVTKIDEGDNALTLDDGRVLKFRDTADCCAWFNGELRAGNLTDNAITAVKVTENQDPENVYGNEDYTIHILAADKNIADLDITGDPTSGYYCHSIDLEIYTPEEKQ